VSSDVLAVNNPHSFVHLFSPAHMLGPTLFTNPPLATWYGPLLDYLTLFAH